MRAGAKRTLPWQAHPSFPWLFFNFLLFGGVATTIGATLPLVIRSMEWSYLIMGGVIAANAAGYFISTFLSGLLIHRTGPRALMFGGLWLQAGGIGLFGSIPSFGLNLAVFIALGIGQGAIEVATNYAVVHMERPGQSRLMNLVHAAFPVGAILAPFSAGLIVAWELPWRYVYAGLGFASILMILWLARGILRTHEFNPPASEAQAEGWPSGNRWLLLLLTLTIFLYVGAELGISSWIAEYYVKVFSASPATGAFLVSFFWFGILLGRLVASAWQRGDQPARVLAAMSLLSALFLGAALVLKSPALSAFFFFGTGLAYSVIYPLSMAIVGKYYGNHRGPALGLVSTGGGVGFCIFPFLMSAISDRHGLVFGFWFYALLTLAMVATALGVLGITRSISVPDRVARAEALQADPFD